jgi:hypothetical protein
MFPSYPLYKILSPSEHATTIWKCDNFLWTAQNIKEAAECFCIPAGTNILLFMPELSYHDKLIEMDVFQVRSPKSPIMGEQAVTGVKPCCPWCRNNSGVEFRCWECQNLEDAPWKGIHSDASITPFLEHGIGARAQDVLGGSLVELLMLALVMFRKLMWMVIQKRTIKMEYKKFGAAIPNLLPTTVLLCGRNSAFCNFLQQ